MSIPPDVQAPPATVQSDAPVPMTYSFLFMEDALLTILQGLSKLPYEQTAGLIQGIQGQAKAQQEAHAAALAKKAEAARIAAIPMTVSKYQRENSQMLDAIEQMVHTRNGDVFPADFKSAFIDFPGGERIAFYMYRVQGETLGEAVDGLLASVKEAMDAIHNKDGLAIARGTLYWRRHPEVKFIAAADGPRYDGEPPVKDHYCASARLAYVVAGQPASGYGEEGTVSKPFIGTENRHGEGIERSDQPAQGNGHGQDGAGVGAESRQGPRVQKGRGGQAFEIIEADRPD
jgi:hypothetical protein